MVMEKYIPITLLGETLGQRHRYFNALVQESAERALPVNTFERSPEQSAIDRLFKIDLSSRLRNIDYILQNLKDDDLLYISRALKSSWLLNPEYRDIINPRYLEDVLFPEMLTTAITKMKHWLCTHLRDHERCSEFYQYYKKSHFGFAIKFLYHCNSDDIVQELPNILATISPHQLKILSDNCPGVAKLYFDALAVDTEAATSYLTDQKAYFTCVKSLLKSNPQTFREITEKYFIYQLSQGESAHIMQYHKDWFNAKSELYTACLLHIPTLAKYLSSQECEEIVVKLARANYLSWWFSYKNVEPLIKRLDLDQRAAFKKRVFVDKSVGDLVEEWPYPTPAAPTVASPEPHVFDDVQYTPWFQMDFRGMLRKRKYSKWNECKTTQKTELDRLFDEFRFVGFSRTLHELSRRLGATSSMESRRFIFLVLVSKTGGRSENVATLLELLARHINEPSNLRAAVVRSLVKRACVWRLPDESWNKLVIFGHGLGLDCEPEEDECREGFHAVMLRHFISDQECHETLLVKFLSRLTTFSEYPLAPVERSKVVSGMTRLIITKAVEFEPDEAGDLLCNLFHLYETHRIGIDAKSEIVAAVMALVDRDHGAARTILSLLFDARVARKELFMANLLFLSEDREYLNVLRHNPKVLVPENIVEQLSRNGKNRLDQFMRKLSIYFNERGGLAEQMLKALSSEITSDPDVTHARPLVTVIGRDLKPYLENFQPSSDDDKVLVRIAAALRANAHYARPKLDIDSFELSKIGAKALANKTLVCRRVDVDKYVSKLLSWRRTVRIALTLAQRGNNKADAFSIGIKHRPQAALKAALQYFCSRGEDREEYLSVWNTVRPQVSVLVLNEKEGRAKSHRAIAYIKKMALTVKIDYCVMLFVTLNKEEHAINILYRDVEDIIPYMNSSQFDLVLSAMIESYHKFEPSILYPSAFVKYLLLCETEEEQRRRLENIGQQYLDCLEQMVKYAMNRPWRPVDLEEINMTLQCLKYNTVFFDARFVSSFPIFKRVLIWMKEILPMANYFSKYVEIHLTMLYYTAVMESTVKAPEIFGDADERLNRGVDLVGVLFGRYIARDLRELMVRYFESVIELYADAMQHYLRVYFVQGSSSKRFLKAVVRGIIYESVGRECRLVVFMLQQQYVCLSDVPREALQRNKELKFLLYATVTDI